MIFLEDKKIRRKFVFINSLRIAVLSALLFIAIFLLLFDVQFPAAPIIIALVAAFLLSLLHFPLFKRLHYRTAVYIQLMVDITLITVLVYFSESFRSPFYFLYLLPIIISSLFLTRKDTIYIASFSFIIFGILCNLVYLQIIPFYPPGRANIEISLGNFIYNLTMSFMAFSVIAVISSYYFDKIKKTDAELKHAQENLRDVVVLNNTVMERMENGFVTGDSNGKIISYNEKAKLLLKLERHSNIFQLLFRDREGSQIERLLVPGKKYYFETQFDNLVLGISVSVLEHIYSFDKLNVFIITDLTERRAIEERLKTQEHLALIGEMSAGIAHEIRNPLASISGSVQFLRRELTLESHEYKNLMDIIVKESDRLSQSIEDFLDFTKTSPLEMMDMDLSALMEEVLDLVSVNYQKIAVVKKYGPGNPIYADMKKIKQLLWNLINNAVKAVKFNGTVEVDIFIRDGDVYLSVKDDGIGIEPWVLEKIYTPFFSKFTSGIGLGMALVKRILDEHHFSISIDSQKNIGTEVTVCFKTK